MSGICNFNLIPVRASASDKSELITQLLFGDTYQVTGESDNRKWISILIDEDNYEGWIDRKLHIDLTAKAPLPANSQNHFCSESVGYLESNGISKIIFFGSYLPTFDGKYVYINSNRFSFRGNFKKTEKIMSPEPVIAAARMFLETPYLWGGKSHAGIDCSGLVQIVFRSCGYRLKRDAWQQASMGVCVESLQKAKSGDLAFFSNEEGRITHVGILSDNQTIIHAHGKVRIDKIDNTGIINGDSGIYSHKLDSIRTIIGQSIN